MEIKSDPSNNYIRIDFAPEWAFIGSIRGFIESFTFICIKNNKIGKAVALAASELLENAVKYSVTEKIMIDFQFEHHPDNRKAKAILRVFNYTDDNHIKTLKSIIDDIYQYSPKEAYLKRMQKALLEEKSSVSSQIGLSRIRYECNASIKTTVGEDNLVTIIATMEALND